MDNTESEQLRKQARERERERERERDREGVTRVNSTNVQYEGLGIGGVGRRMNSKVKLVKECVYQK
jgi:hypothetical protein